MADKIPQFSICPRCGDRGYDRLRTHCYCVLCNYSPDFDAELSVPEWVLKYLGDTRGAFTKPRGPNPPNGGAKVRSRSYMAPDISIARLPMEMRE